MPVNGTSVARRGAELALAIAAVTGAPVKMLYVARVGRDEPRDTVSHRRREAVLKDIVALADRYGVEIETAIRSREHPHNPWPISCFMLSVRFYLVLSYQPRYRPAGGRNADN